MIHLQSGACYPAPRKWSIRVTRQVEAVKTARSSIVFGLFHNRREEPPPFQETGDPDVKTETNLGAPPSVFEGGVFDFSPTIGLRAWSFSFTLFDSTSLQIDEIDLCQSCFLLCIK